MAFQYKRARGKKVMKKSILFLVLMSVSMAPAPVSANQGSVSFACNASKTSDTVVEINLEGITFTVDQLGRQGYSVSGVSGILVLNRGTESLVIGSLQKTGSCDVGEGKATSFIRFTNSNLAVGSETQQLSGCEAITADGTYGIKQTAAVSLVAIDNGFSMELDQTFTQDYGSLKHCQAALK
jgi:hypothetical protein